MNKGVITIHKNGKFVWKRAVIQGTLCFWLTVTGCGSTVHAMSPAMAEIARMPEGKLLYNETDAKEDWMDPGTDVEAEAPVTESMEETRETGSYEYRFVRPQEYAMYTSLRVNLREGPGTDTEVLTVLNPNAEVTVLDHRDGWYQVRYKTGGEDTEIKFGYIKDDYLLEEKLQQSEMNKWNIELTSEEIDLLAKILWVEARGEPYEGQAAVIEVIFNRMISQDGDFPENDLVGIVSSTTNGTQFASWKLRDTADPGANLYQVIYDVLEGNVEVLPSTDYVFFTRRGIGRNIIRIGNHRFGTQ